MRNDIRGDPGGAGAFQPVCVGLVGQDQDKLSGEIGRLGGIDQGLQV
jgi:hypothetical protein